MEIDLIDTFINLDNISINIVKTFEHDPNDPLPLLHLELIDWDSPPIPKLYMLHNDDAIIDYLSI